MTDLLMIATLVVGFALIFGVAVGKMMLRPLECLWQRFVKIRAKSTNATVYPNPYWRRISNDKGRLSVFVL